MPSCTPFTAVTSTTVTSVLNGNFVLDRRNKRIISSSGGSGTSVSSGYIAGVNTDTSIKYADATGNAYNSLSCVDEQGLVYVAPSVSSISRKVHKLSPTDFSIVSSSADTDDPTGGMFDIRAGFNRVAVACNYRAIVVDTGGMAILGNRVARTTYCTIDSNGNGWFWSSSLTSPGGYDTFYRLVALTNTLTTFLFPVKTFGHVASIAYDTFTGYLLVWDPIGIPPHAGTLYFWDTATSTLVDTLYNVEGDSNHVSSFRSSLGPAHFLYTYNGSDVSKINLDTRTIDCTTNTDALKLAHGVANWDGGVFDGVNEYALWVSVHSPTTSIEKLTNGTVTIPTSSITLGNNPLLTWLAGHVNLAGPPLTLSGVLALAGVVFPIKVCIRLFKEAFKMVYLFASGILKNKKC